MRFTPSAPLKTGQVKDFRKNSLGQIRAIYYENVMRDYIRTKQARRGGR